MVDLSKAKAGDTVKFRCGGEAVIWLTYPAEIDVFKFQFKGYQRTEWYSADGRNTVCGGSNMLDITAIIPAQFDWSTVKWGQAFRYDMYDDGNEVVAIYVGKSPTKGFVVCKVEQTDGSYTYAEIFPHELTRAHEHDVTEK